MGFGCKHVHAESSTWPYAITLRVVAMCVYVARVNKTPVRLLNSCHGHYHLLNQANVTVNKDMPSLKSRIVHTLGGHEQYEGTPAPRGTAIRFLG